MFPPRIDLNPEILNGKPIIHGTRISVAQILDHLASGWTYEEIIENYPHLEPADIMACIRYASIVIEETRGSDTNGNGEHYMCRTGFKKHHDTPWNHHCHHP
jgi:uncharacterized protein (DUF433 family)